MPPSRYTKQIAHLKELKKQHAQLTSAQNLSDNTQTAIAPTDETLTGLSSTTTLFLAYSNSTS